MAKMSAAASQRAFQRPRFAHFAAAVLAGLVAARATEAQAAQRASFAVVSLREIADRDTKWGGLQRLPGRVRAPRDTVVELIEIACDVQAAQVLGSPQWARSVRYDITLEAPESSLAGPFHGDRQAQHMLQTLLAERFKLSFHRESGYVRAAALVVAPGGITMRPSGHQAGDWQGIELAPGRLVGQAAPMSRLTRILALSTGQTTLDSTGLTGTYDFDASWTADRTKLSSHRWEYDGAARPAGDGQGLVLPSFGDALRERLGLVLEPPGDREAQLIVVDHVEQPLIDD
jgi:bla regulator protein blaR1